jgi:hypothetical protein
VGKGIDGNGGKVLADEVDGIGLFYCPTRQSALYKKLLKVK